MGCCMPFKVGPQRSSAKSMILMLGMHDAHDELKAIDLNLVLALDALLAERHVTRAASRLGLTQCAASPAGSYEKVLFDETFTCIVRAGHPLADARMTLARYCAAPHLLVAPRGTPGSVVD